VSAALKVSGLTAGYGNLATVRDLDFELAPGELLALLGPNGAGKTTALLAIAGAIRPMAGSVTSFGKELTSKTVEAIARLGVALVPDDRGLFFNLTVAEHLRLARVPNNDEARERALDGFPQLRPLLHRRCGLLSGGEQQMLALAKTLATEPPVLLIDEMSLGLAPLVVQRLLPQIKKVATEHGTAVVLVEQHVELALRVADRAIVLSRGQPRLTGDARALLADRALVEAAYFN
jgi:branched-chain amino acid transport system ATP-binding protein